MPTLHSILAEDAANLAPTLRRIARAFLDRDHLRAASGRVPEDAETAIIESRYRAALAELADGFTTIDGTPVPGVCTVRDAEGRSRLYLHYRDPQYPTVEAFGPDGEALGGAHLAVQFPAEG